MVALKLGFVQLVEYRRGIVGVPNGHVLLRRRIETTVGKSGHRGIRNRSLETFELRCGEHGSVRDVGHVLHRSGNAAIGGALEADGRATT